MRRIFHVVTLKPSTKDGKTLKEEEEEEVTYPIKFHRRPYP